MNPLPLDFLISTLILFSSLWMSLLLARGSGTRVWDGDGNEYTDCLAEIAVDVCGHRPHVDNHKKR